MSFPYFLRLAYIGTDFHGWQIQTHLRSVQADLWKALRAFDPVAPMPQGTGRTDAGVHAKAQGVIIRMTREWDPYRLLSAINAHLAPDARVCEALPVHEDFWPRHHALAKRYVYRIHQGQADDPFERNHRWYVHGRSLLDAEAMAKASGFLIGTHDFSSFRHQECAAKTPVRTIYKVDIVEQNGKIDLVFEGNRFLMHQVRIMAGTLVDIGKGRILADHLGQIIAGRDRSKAGLTAPPHGLCLEEVWYETKWGIGVACPWGNSPEIDPH
ncbi:MAG: tRNA pseudouridine(38-40) synthase TruA [Holophaga sp.]|nr:tRNA pseudouridine(38-40) synthase TruA [Holophaga sp.]